MTLASSLNPAVYGATVTVTAKVLAGSGPAPSGTVAFRDGSTTIGTEALNSSGVATLATSTLLGGTDSITASFAASTNDLVSTSAALAEIIDKAKTSTTLASSLHPATHGTTVTFTAKRQLPLVRYLLGQLLQERFYDAWDSHSKCGCDDFENKYATGCYQPDHSCLCWEHERSGEHVLRILRGDQVGTALLCRGSGRFMKLPEAGWRRRSYA